MSPTARQEKQTQPGIITQRTMVPLGIAVLFLGVGFSVSRWLAADDKDRTAVLNDFKLQMAAQLTQQKIELTSLANSVEIAKLAILEKIDRFGEKVVSQEQALRELRIVAVPREEFDTWTRAFNAHNPALIVPTLEGK